MLRHPLSRIVLAAALLLGCPGVFNQAPAQDLNELLRLLESGDMGSNETESQIRQTIERALNDFENGTIEEQAGALMLLGKYNRPESRAALHKGLRSMHVRVRRAALISVLENQRSIIPFEETRLMLPMLGDGDVEIRRQISSILPQLATSWRIGLNQIRNRPTQQGWPQGWGEMVVNAFRDEDATVRLNMVQNSSSVASIREILPLLVERLEDDDARVRLLALRQSGRLADSGAFVAAVQSTTLGENPLWDRELARQLVNHARHPEARELLEALAASADRNTQIEAEISQLYVFEQPLERSPAFERMMTESVPPEAVQRALRTVYGLEREEASRIAQRLFEAESSVVREEALVVWDSLYGRLPDDAMVVRLLDDPSAQVRSRALRALRNRWQEIGISLLQEMAAASNRETRLAVFHFLEDRPGDELRSLLMPLLIDSDTGVRERALGALAEHQVRGWERILERSLRDPNPRIQRAAAQQLLAKRAEHPQGLQVLADWIEAHPDSEVARQFGQRVRSALNAQQAPERG
ncbi:MAG: HEAT repeat domain-containing protein [Opitutales bacterium]|nr:HEAT repeat domain-containing protein [Opitutales bacterium]